MDLDIRGKKALVMASSSGIGRAVAASLIAEGVDVAICARAEDRLARTAREIGAGLYFTCDLAVAGSARELVDKILGAWGSLDILVCNTGGPERSFFVDTPAEHWHSGFQSLWMSVVESSQAALGSMIRNEWGRIVLLTSVTGKEAQPGLTIASALRTGLHGLTRIMSNEISAHGVTVNAVLPGFIQTERLKAMAIPVERISGAVPARRLGEPSEIGDLVAFLASKRASNITGQLIACDGGILKGL
jgi:3-oxoacyl-[acyl-carrier protein] reductase